MSKRSIPLPIRAKLYVDGIMNRALLILSRPDLESKMIQELVRKELESLFVVAYHAGVEDTAKE